MTAFSGKNTNVDQSKTAARLAQHYGLKVEYRDGFYWIRRQNESAWSSGGMHSTAKQAEASCREVYIRAGIKPPRKIY